MENKTAVNNNEQWQLRAKHFYQQDPLLGCLTILLKIEHKKFPKTSLIQGLPLENNALTPDLFIVAAKRAGLDADILAYDLTEINSLALPVILLLKDKQAVVLIKKLAGNKVRIIHPGTPSGYQDLPVHKLAENYTGFTIFTKASFEFDERASIADEEIRADWFWSVLKKSWQVYAEVILASICINLFAIVSPLFAMNVYDRVVPNAAFDTLYVLAFGAVVVYLFDFVMKLLRGYFIDVVSKRADVTMSANIFSQMLNVKLAARPESVGSFISNLNQFESFREFFTSATMSAIIDFPFVLFFTVMVYWLGGGLAMVALCTIPVVILAGILVQKPLNAVVKESYKYAAQKQAMLIESLTSIDTIKSVAAESVVQKRWEHVLGMSAKTSAKMRNLSSFATTFTSLMQQLASVLVIVLGVSKIADGEITMGALIACSILTSRALAPLGQVANLLTRYHQSKASVSGIDNMMQLPTERAKTVSSLNLQHLSGKIEFSEVGFSYPKQVQPALEKVSFSIQPGEKVGIVGSIGSGKSTIEKLILGLYDPLAGNVLLDDIDIRQIDKALLRKSIGYMAQEVHLFYGTVKDNIAYGAPYVDDTALIKAAKQTGVLDFVASHPDGFNLQVGERGEKLSGGQRQAIALARTLLLEPDILVLDEPTNMMDTRTEMQIKHNLAEYLKPHRTLVLITHRGSMLSLVDRLIVLNRGKVVADGPRDDVLQALAQLESSKAKVK